MLNCHEFKAGAELGHSNFQIRAIIPDGGIESAQASIRISESTVIKSNDVAVVRQPSQSLAKFGEMRASIDILIVNNTPNPERLSCAPFNVVNLSIGDHVGKNSGYQAILFGADTGLALRCVWGCGEDIRQCYAVRKDFGFSAIAHIVSGGLAVVRNHRLSLESEAGCPILINGSANYHRQVCTQLRSSRFDQQISGPDKAASNAGQKNCSDCSDGGIMLINEEGRTIRSENAIKEKGNIFWLLLGRGGPTS
jgi:hypothetical protein